MASSSMTPDLDLTLPSHNPALLKDYREKCTFEAASIALYTLTSLPLSRLQEIASIPQSAWEDCSMETQLVRTAKPTPIISSTKLSDVVRAHEAMDKEVEEREEGANDIGWLPYCFVVVTQEDVEERGLLLVYADSEVDGEGKEGAMGKFFFKKEDMFELLSGLILGTYGFGTLKRLYDVDKEEEEEEEE